jgi:uroporphyrinogen-III synthase
VVSDELAAHGLGASISPPEGAYFMKPLISAMATELVKSPPRVAR